MKETGQLQLPPYREMRTKSEEDPDAAFAAALVNASAVDAWQALQKGADTQAYVYCFYAPDSQTNAPQSICALARQSFRELAERNVYYYDAAYMALYQHIGTEALPAAGQNVNVHTELSAILAPETRPSLTVARQNLFAKTGYAKSSNASVDMLDVAYETMGTNTRPGRVEARPSRRTLS